MSSSKIDEAIDEDEDDILLEDLTDLDTLKKDSTKIDKVTDEEEDMLLEDVREKGTCTVKNANDVQPSPEEEMLLLSASPSSDEGRMPEHQVELTCVKEKEKVQDPKNISIEDSDHLSTSSLDEEKILEPKVGQSGIKEIQQKVPNTKNITIEDSDHLSTSCLGKDKILQHKPGPSGIKKAPDQKNITIEDSDLSNSSLDEEKIYNHKAGSSKRKGKEAMISNITIEDSEEDPEDSFEDSVEVIESYDEEDDDEEDEEIESESFSDDSQSAFMDGKVQIYRAQGAFFIWNTEDVQMLREECRIVGKLVGCLPRAPRQNNQLGLPLQLMPEEAKLLEDIEAACVVEEIEEFQVEAEMKKSSFEEMREENFKVQQLLYKESRKEEVLQLKDKIIKGKLAKKRKLLEQESFDKEENGEPDLKLTKMIDDSAAASGVKGSKEEDSGNGGYRVEIKTVKAVDAVLNDDSKEKVLDVIENVLDKDMTANLGKDISNSKTKTSSEVEIASQSIDTQTDRSTGKDDKGGKNCLPSDERDEGISKAIRSDASTEDKSEDCEVIDLDADAEDEDEEKNKLEEEFDADEIVTAETDVKHCLVQLYTENPWQTNVKRSKNWIFPLSQKEFLRYQVFKDLWKKGYFLTSGSKFGGDFLVYPGDPARFHSHFIAVCIDKTVDLSALDIISLGRLGSNVRKTVLLCALNKARHVEYTSLQWTGLS